MRVSWVLMLSSVYTVLDIQINITKDEKHQQILTDWKRGISVKKHDLNDYLTNQKGFIIKMVAD